MEITSQGDPSRKKRRLLLIFNCIILGIGNCGGPLITRLYFLDGGKSVWFSSWMETGGWPMNLIPLLLTYIQRRRSEGSNAKLLFITPRIFMKAAIIGVLTGVDDYVYAYGLSKLPVSTTVLLIATQLAFTAGFARLLVNQKFTAASVNAIVLLTIGAGCLAIGASGDRPTGETEKEYILGFVLTLTAACLYGFVLPWIELTYRTAKQAITYTLVLEMQLVMCFFSTSFCSFGLLVSKDFKTIPDEANAFSMGVGKYIAVCIGSAVLWQLFFMGVVGVSCFGSSLMSGIIISALTPVTEVLGVLFYHEKFRGEKALSLVLALWGFVSYFYGEMQTSKESKDHEESQDLNPSQTLPI
nr:purine permease 3-like [Ipomoea batatas]GMD91270.1 purine permease 3-like [Ipomoea batatas]GMD94002.1 purine permease 3-like [Ipomoea batatas]